MATPVGGLPSKLLAMSRDDAVGREPSPAGPGGVVPPCGFGAAHPSSAVFSPGSPPDYRYLLTRRWAPGPVMTWVMLNPSRADETADDPTIRRCVRFARSAGCTAITVANLYAWRTSNPRELRRIPDAIGPTTTPGFAPPSAQPLADQSSQPGERGRNRPGFRQYSSCSPTPFSSRCSVWAPPRLVTLATRCTCRRVYRYSRSTQPPLPHPTRSCHTSGDPGPSSRPGMGTRRSPSDAALAAEPTSWPPATVSTCRPSRTDGMPECAVSDRARGLGRRARAATDSCCSTSRRRRDER
jgi:hypothetical protein